MSLELLNDTQKILNEVREISGKEVVFRENNSLKTYAIAKTARSGMKNHIIYYKPVHSGILNYIIAHECGHMIRIYKETNERLMPYSDNELMEKALYMVDKNCKVKYTDDIKRKIFPMWVNGIITQLTSIPEDIRIEKWIYGNFPEIREMQKSALESQSKEIGDAISPKIKQMTPEFVYEGSGVINYYFLKSLDDIIKTDTLGAMENASFYQLAVKLVGEIRERMETEDTLANSIAISKFLADKLGFGRWFKWKDFEDIPEGYEEEIYY